MLYDAKNLAIHLLKSLFETGLRHYADHPGAFHDHPPPWPVANYLLPVTWKTKEPLSDLHSDPLNAPLIRMVQDMGNQARVEYFFH